MLEHLQKRMLLSSTLLHWDKLTQPVIVKINLYRNKLHYNVRLFLQQMLVSVCKGRHYHLVPLELVVREVEPVAQ